MKKFYQDETWLWEQFVDEGRTAQDIADELGVSIKTIWRYLKEFGIKRPQKELVAKPKKKTQTLKQAFDGHIALDEALKELEEIQEWKKAIEGKPSNYYENPAEVEANKQVAEGKRKAERERQLKEDFEYEKRKQGGGAWDCGDVEEEMQGILEITGDYI